MAIMDEFKPASTLYDDHKTTKKQSPTNIRKHKCEHYSPECCEVSREAVNLGLAEKLFLCTGNIPPDCKIRQDLKAGKTIQEIYQK